MIYERDILPKQEHKEEPLITSKEMWIFRFGLTAGLTFCIGFWVLLILVICKGLLTG